MESVMRFFRKLSLLFSRKKFSAELDEEMAFHRAQAEREYQAQGMSPEAARLASLRRFGNVTHLNERSHEQVSFRFEQVLQDVQFALRQLRKNPGFALVILAILALGIGACTAIFSLVNAVLLRSLPYGEPDRLVYLFTPNSDIPIPAEIISPSYADFFDIKQQNHSFSHITAFEQATFSVAEEGLVDRIGAARVDENFFATLASSPQLGRAIRADDTRAGHDKVAVISHALWQSMFAGGSNVLARTLRLDGVSYRIIGVMPSSFEYPNNLELPYGNSSIKSTRIWLPLVLSANQRADREPDDNVTIARLRPGVSLLEAQTEMSAIMNRLDRLHSARLRGSGALVKGFVDNALGSVRSLMWMLLSSVFLVLLIACGNATNLLLARAASRTRELGVRVALGAGRIRILRQLLTESLLIALAAGILGVGLAALFLRFLPHLDPGNIPRLNQASIDGRALAFTAAVALLTCILTGTLPALAVSRTSPRSLLSTGRNVTRQSRTQNALVVIETTLVVVLLVCAGLLIRSYIHVQSVETGFSTSTATMNIWPDIHFRQLRAERAAFFKSLIDKIAVLPGVQAVGAVDDLPLSNSESIGFFWVEGFANQKGQLVEARSATPQYLTAMSIPLVQGRLFTDQDASNPLQPTIINQRFADLYFAGRNPIGGRVSTDETQKKWSTVIGVIGNVRHSSLDEAPKPQMYHANYDFGDAALAVRSALPPVAMAAQIHSALNTIDPNLALTDIRTMDDLVSDASAKRRFQTSLLTVFAAVALLLALVGIYGLMAYSVNGRTQEMGVRMALGARREDIVLLVLRHTAWLLGSGLAGGLACAWVASRTLRTYLFGLSAHDPVTILSVCVILATGGMFAAYLPARRAARVNPIEALRAE